MLCQIQAPMYYFLIYQVHTVSCSLVVLNKTITPVFNQHYYGIDPIKSYFKSILKKRAILENHMLRVAKFVLQVYVVGQCSHTVTGVEFHKIYPLASRAS